MKKLLFFFCLIFAANFAFADSANNSKNHNLQESYGTCTYYITQITIHEDGRITETTTKYTTFAFSESHCREIAKVHAAFLNEAP
ncbi:hypothetical protein [uncultured Mesonia sp.]|uniref:hypothetical protein n=1 Tax=uncultured Mesonia sp. TaxID=399731 RepID=UPI00374F9A12